MRLLRENMIPKLLKYLKKKKMGKRYKTYYSALTPKDKSDEIELLEDFKFSDHELELLLKSKESDQ